MELNTGFKSIDERIGGLKGGELIMVAGGGHDRDIVLNIMYNIATQEKIKSNELKQQEKLIYVVNIYNIIQEFTPFCPRSADLMKVEQLEELRKLGEKFHNLPILDIGDERFSICSFKNFMKKIEYYESDIIEYSKFSAIVVGAGVSTFQYLKTLKEIAIHFNVPIIMSYSLTSKHNDDARWNINYICQIREYKKYFDKYLFVYQKSQFKWKPIKGKKYCYSMDCKEDILDKKIDKIKRQLAKGALSEEKLGELQGKISKFEEEKEELKSWNHKAEIIYYRAAKAVPEIIEMVYIPDYEDKERLFHFEEKPCNSNHPY